MKLFIPDIGTELILAADWTFGLYDEGRNDSLMEFVNDPRLISEHRWRSREKDEFRPVTIPKGEHLRVDRIYIRKGKGMSDYSSVTFFWIGKRTEARIDHQPEYTYRDYDYSHDYSSRQYVNKIEPARDIKIPRKPIRFWAKLADVNTMEIE
jgi:hypothetical protein